MIKDGCKTGVQTADGSATNVTFLKLFCFGFFGDSFVKIGCATLFLVVMSSSAAYTYPSELQY